MVRFRGSGVFQGIAMYYDGEYDKVILSAVTQSVISKTIYLSILDKDAQDIAKKVVILATAIHKELRRDLSEKLVKVLTTPVSE